MKDHKDITIELLQENLSFVTKEVVECHQFLNSIKVPTNGIEGHGKRQSLTLLQRIKKAVNHKD